MIAKASATKILASLALVAGAAGVAGLGTFGEFTDSTTAADNSVASGTIGIDIGNPAQAQFAVTGMLPNDTIQRPLTLTRDADSEEFGKVTLAVTATDSPLLTDAHGLVLSVDACSTAWTVNADKSMTCAAPTNLLSQTGVRTGAAPVDLAEVVEDLNATDNAYLRVMLSLPGVAGNNLQGQNTTVDFAFTAYQRTGKNL